MQCDSFVQNITNSGYYVSKNGINCNDKHYIKLGKIKYKVPRTKCPDP